MAKPFAPLGSTGEFPRGNLEEGDKGALRLGVTVYRGTVIMAFGESVEWIGMTPATARELAQILLLRADAAAKVS